MIQHPIGFGMQGVATPPVQGMELYVRWRARVLNQFEPGTGSLGWGGKFIMIDNAAEDTPTGASPETFAVDVTPWSGTDTRFGGFVALSGSPVPDPAPIIEMCGFEIDDEFDPGWHEP